MKSKELRFKFSKSENVLKLNAMNYNAIACCFHFVTSATLMAALRDMLEDGCVGDYNN